MQCCHSVIQLLGSPLAINFWLKITIMPITCTLNHIISIFCHYTVIVITSMFHELPCQRDENTHQWQFWLHENYKCNVVRSDNEWAREAILRFLNWFLRMTIEEGFGCFVSGWTVNELWALSWQMFTDNQAIFAYFFLIWVCYLQSPSVHEMRLYSCQYARSKMVGRIAPKCARTVKSTVWYTGVHPLRLNLKWCFAFRARYLEREVLKQALNIAVYKWQLD